jgi:hypothetical protein
MAQRRRRDGGAPRGAAARRAISFRRLTGALVDRLEVVVRFLALLELFKQGLVELDQAGSFADLVVCGSVEEGDGPRPRWRRSPMSGRRRPTTAEPVAD